MSHPSINRWGLNLFWYNLWFTDKNYSFLLHQDRVFTIFFSTYVNYGLLYPVNPLTHKYWYFKKNLKKISYEKNHNFKYFRLGQYKNFQTKTYESYTLRSGIQHMYVSKVWLLRYGDWFILNFYCFRPKESDLIAQIKQNKTKKHLSTISFETYESFSIIKRIKFILNYYYLNKLTSNASYLF